MSYKRKPLRIKKQLKDEVSFWARKIKVEPKQIRIQEMSKKWASCSTKGWVSFSTDLLEKPRRFQEYVIVHELIHLIVPNHGKLFKTMMSVCLPGWEKIEAEQIRLFNRNI